MADPDKASLDRIEDAIAKLAATQIHVANKLEDLLLRVANLENTAHSTHSPSSSSPNPVITTSPNHAHKMKLDVPRFDGSDPSGWIFKITQFFAYHSTPESEKLTIASYMEGPTLAWFQWLTRNHQLTTWPSFLEAVEARFAHSPYEDPTGILFKLTQKGTVTQYLTQFEALANRIVGLSPSLLLSCFISGLEPDICHEVQALQPLTIVHAIGLARLQEEKLVDTRRPFRGHATQTFPPPPPTHPPPTLPLSPPSLAPSPLPLLPTPPKPPPVPLKRLTPAEMASRREQGLCFNCDEKFT